MMLLFADLVESESGKFFDSFANSSFSSSMKFSLSMICKTIVLRLSRFSFEIKYSNQRKFHYCAKTICWSLDPHARHRDKDEIRRRGEKIQHVSRLSTKRRRENAVDGNKEMNFYYFSFCPQMLNLYVKNSLQSAWSDDLKARQDRTLRVPFMKTRSDSLK